MERDGNQKIKINIVNQQERVKVDTQYQIDGGVYHPTPSREGRRLKSKEINVKQEVLKCIIIRKDKRQLLEYIIYMYVCVCV